MYWKLLLMFQLCLWTCLNSCWLFLSVLLLAVCYYICLACWKPHTIELAVQYLEFCSCIVSIVLTKSDTIICFKEPGIKHFRVRLKSINIIQGVFFYQLFTVLTKHAGVTPQNLTHWCINSMISQQPQHDKMHTCQHTFLANVPRPDESRYLPIKT